MAKKRRKQRRKVKPKEAKVQTGIVMYGGYSSAEPKKVLEVGELIVWAGPWHARNRVRFTHFLALNGEEVGPRVKLFGLKLPIKLPQPKGVSIDWPDMSVPDGLDREFWEALATTLAKEKGVLYIGCSAGKGRTGTALAILVGLWGISTTPIAYVRGHYHPEAVETDAQVEYVAEITGFREDKVVRTPTQSVYGAYNYGQTQPRWWEEDYNAYFRWSQADTVDAIMKSILPAILQDPDFRGAGMYAPYEKDGFVILEGAVSTLAIKTWNGKWRIYYIRGKEVEGSEDSELLRESPLVQKFVAQEAALVNLLDEIGINPTLAKLDSYRVGDVEIDENGVYKYEGVEVSLAQAAALLALDKGGVGE